MPIQDVQEVGAQHLDLEMIESHGLENIRGELAQENFHEACLALSLHVIIVSEQTAVSTIESLYELLFQLIPKVEREDLGRLSECCSGSVLQRLFLFPSLVNQQWNCAVAFGDAYLKRNNFLKAITFYSIAIDLAEQEIPMRLGESHQKASAVIFEALKRHFVAVDDFNEFLSMARGRGGEEEFLKALEYVETVRQFACLPDHLSFIQQLYKQAHLVLLELSPEKRGLYQKSILAIQRGLLASKVDPLSSLTEKLRVSLQDYRKHFRSCFEETPSDPHEVRALQRAMTANFQELLKTSFLTPLTRIMRIRPCAYDLLSMGSVAREEVCPYSDLEWILLVEDPNERSHFEPFIKLFDLLLRSLRESPMPQEFSALRSPHKTGLHLDMGAALEELIQTTNFPQTRGFEYEFEPRSLPCVMMRVRSIFHVGSNLLPEYNASMHVVLEKDIDGMKLRIHRAIRILEIRMAEYRHSQDPFTGNLIDIKKDFVEPLFLTIGDLALYYDISSQNTLDIIDELEKQEVFTQQTCSLLKACVAMIYQLRVRLQIFYEEDKALASLEKSQTNECVITAVLTNSEKKILQCAHYLLLVPLYDLLSVWLHRETDKPPFHKTDLPNRGVEMFTQASKTDSKPSKAKAFISAIRHHLEITGDSLPKHRWYFRMCTSATNSEPLRELFLLNHPHSNELLEIPKANGERLPEIQREKRFQESLKELLVDDTPLKGLVVQVSFPNMPPGFLEPEIVQQIFSEEGEWKICERTEISVGESKWVLDPSPKNPLMEFAVHNFTQRFMGVGTACSMLAKIEIKGSDLSLPVLICEALEGEVVTKIEYKSPDNIEGGAEFLETEEGLVIDNHHLTLRCIRDLFLLSMNMNTSRMLIDAGGRLHDCEPANPIALVHQLSDQTPRIDTFYPFPYSLASWSEIAQAHMMNLSMNDLLNSWRDDVRGREESYRTLFKDAALPPDFHLRIPFGYGLKANIHQRFEKIRQVLKEYGSLTYDEAKHLRLLWEEEQFGILPGGKLIPLKDYRNGVGRKVLNLFESF